MLQEKGVPEVKISLEFSPKAQSHPSLLAVSPPFQQNSFLKVNPFHYVDAQAVAQFSEDNLPVLPIEIFCNNALSSLEITSKYLLENEQMSVGEIASILNRDYKTVWGAYQSAKHKMSERIIDCPHDDSKVLVPLSIFFDRNLGMFESLVCFLKESYHLRFCQISRLVLRDQRTIWVTYDRAKKKRNNYEHN